MLEYLITLVIEHPKIVSCRPPKIQCLHHISSMSYSSIVLLFLFWNKWLSYNFQCWSSIVSCPLNKCLLCIICKLIKQFLNECSQKHHLCSHRSSELSLVICLRCSSTESSCSRWCHVFHWETKAFSLGQIKINLTCTFCSNNLMVQLQKHVWVWIFD